MPLGSSSGQSSIEAELSANSDQFFEDWLSTLNANARAHSKKALHAESFARLSAFNGVVSIISPHFEEEARKFLLEAQNDAVLSHVSATFGSWRVSLQSLRSFVENSLCAIFYASHPIELRLWDAGKFRIGFREMAKFVETHPDIAERKCSDKAIGELQSEYASLSHAVHGSAKVFRMTDAASDIVLWDKDPAKYSKWATRHRNSMSSVAVLMLTLFLEHFRGASNLEARRALHFIFGSARRREIAAELKITIPNIK